MKKLTLEELEKMMPPYEKYLGRASKEILEPERTCIKEILLLWNCPGDVKFNQEEIPLELWYQEGKEFDFHLVLFSKVSDPCLSGDGVPFPFAIFREDEFQEGVLTQSYLNSLKDIKSDVEKQKTVLLKEGFLK